MQPTFLHFLLVLGPTLIVSTSAQERVPSGCEPSRVFDALVTSAPRAARFCNSFTKTEQHAWYPSFIIAACGQTAPSPKAEATGNPAIDDSILSAACDAYMASVQTNTLLSSSQQPVHGASRPNSAHEGVWNPSSVSVIDGSDINNGNDLWPRLEACMSKLTSYSDNFGPQPTTTLVPVVHFQHDLTNVSNLIPQDASTLFYAEQSYKTMNVFLSYPTVVIEHTHFLTNFVCRLTKKVNSLTDGSLAFDISSKEAYDIIDNTWPRTKDLVFVFDGKSCDETENDKHAYFLGHLDHLQWSDLDHTGHVKVVGEEIALEEGITDATLEWGTRSFAPDENGHEAVPRETANAELCGEKSLYRMAKGIHSIDPCTSSFDLALDQSMGYLELVPQARQDFTKGLLVNAQAREDIVSEYAFNQAAKRSLLDPRNLGLGKIWGGAKTLGDSVWAGLKDLADEFRKAGTKDANFFINLPAKSSAAAKRLGRIMYEALTASGTNTIDMFKKIASYILKAPLNIAKLIVEGLENLDRKLQSWEPSMTMNLNIDLAPKKLVKSPFGDAWLLVKFGTNSTKLPALTSDDRDDDGMEEAEYEYNEDEEDENDSGFEDDRSQAVAAPPGQTLDAGPGKVLPVPAKPGNPNKPGKPGKPPKDPKARYVRFYCVRCGLHAHNKVSGLARFSLLRGASTLQVGLDGDFQYGMNLGIDAETVKRRAGKERHIIPPLSNPVTTLKGILTFGPIVTVKLGIASNVHDKGRLLTGVNVHMPSYSAHFDLIHPTKSLVRGFKDLSVRKYFTAHGGVEQSAQVHMPFSMGVGVMIPLIRFNQQVKLINKPAFVSQAIGSGSFAKGKRPPDIDMPIDSKCNGITWGLGFSHEVLLDVLGKYRQSLFKFHIPFVEGCYPRRPDKAPVPGHPPHTAEDDFQGNASTSLYTNAGALWGPVDYHPPDLQVHKPKLISDSTHKTVLVSALDGNLYLVPHAEAMTLPERNASTVFADLDATSEQWLSPGVKQQFSTPHARTLVTDGWNRALHFFPASIERFGVSRIRALGTDEVPRGANMTLLEMGRLTKSGERGFYFVHPESPFQALWPVACVVRDAADVLLPKVFAVADPEKGLKSLMGDKDVASAVTGGVVRDCAVLHLVELQCRDGKSGPDGCVDWRGGGRLEPDGGMR
ncbi:hypothetical protein ANO11243_084200 [Dothideomycetidae sp. 11243]|nr:hypothetical protein ANO11243_084200 [fungal sp. No.11243]